MTQKGETAVEVVDLDGFNGGNGVTYLGKAYLQPSGLYKCLADVGGALCLVEVSISIKPIDVRALEQLKLAGSKLANAAFNLAQGHPLDDRVRNSLRESYKEWDDALRRLGRTQHVVEKVDGPSTDSTV